nr:methylenetetrahydrofolate reductase [Lysinibacter cavernae]
MTVTCLPQHGLEPTLRVSTQLADLGYDVIPHLSARLIVSEAELVAHLDRLADHGIRSLFVIGGDGPQHGGPFADGGELLCAVRENWGKLANLGIAAYPEGHPLFNREQGIDLLLHKQSTADYAVTQLCFQAPVVAEFLRDTAAAGVTLPVWIGLPAAVNWRRLVAIGTKIGVGASLAFARKNSALQLLSAAHFDPQVFSAEVTGALTNWANAESEIALPAGIHLYSFNDFRSLSTSRP